MKRSLLRGASPWVFALAALSLAGVATAQEVDRPQPQAEPSEAAEVEEVVVTGSLIRGTPEDAALPVDVISSEELQKQGSPTVVELLKALPVSNGVLGDTNQFDSRAQGSEGVGSVNLRGLGPNRTLVLLNGRRLTNSPFGLAGAGVVNTNLIPINAIGRVEVLKDGAAATYGSDAIAGVVNFITRDNFEGLEVNGDYRFVDGSSGDWQVGANWGWQGDNADVFLSLGAQHRGELAVLDRDFTQSEYVENPEGGYSAASNPGTFLSFTAPAATAATLFRDPQCVALGGYAGFSGTTPACFNQYVDFDNLVEEENRIQGFGSINVDLTDNHEFHVEGHYSRTEIPQWKTTPSYAILSSPSPEAQLAGALQPFYTGRFFVPTYAPGLRDFTAKNPQLANLNNFGAAYLAPAARPLFVGGNPLFDAEGASIGKRLYESFRVSGGFRGDLGIGDLQYDVALTYSQEASSRTGYDTLTNRFALALQGFGGPGCDRQPNVPGIQVGATNTTVTSANAATLAGTNGCGYFNPFSNAIQANVITGQTNPQYNPAVANDPALIGWFFRQLRTDQQAALFVADAVISGSTGLELPGGPVQFAVGGQIRQDFFERQDDPASNELVNPCVASPDFFNDVCTGAQANGPYVFLGTGTPSDLSNDVYALFGELQLPVTDTFNVQLAARYEDYGGAVGSTFDPKISARWQIVDWLALRGSAGSTFRGPPTTQLAPGDITSLQSILGTFRAVDIAGNPNLEPESAETYSLGVILDVGGFKGSIDYYRFDFENPIVAEPVGGIVNAVFPNGATGANNCANPAFAPLVQRFTFTGGVCSAANIGRLFTQVVNGAPVKTSGFDVLADYDFGDRFGGELSVGASATYVLEYKTEAQTVAGIPVTPAFEAVGFLNYQTTAYPLPEWKGQAYAEYERGDHLVRFQVNYIDGYTDQRASLFAPGVYRDSTGAPITVSGGRTLDAFVTADLTYRAQLPWDVTLTANVDNVFDEDPPLARLDLSYDPLTHDALGRTFKLGLRKRF